MPTQFHADIECPICGQSFALYFERQSEAERHNALEEVRCALINHHGLVSTAAAHSGSSFNVPEWSGPANMSAAALLGGAPVHE
ncbi:hypothetical protein [Paracidobacterium acidisoli]|uniref:Uncharacterized protein n=1 Tax=Paracidobacterium acidisoli TaxID=2303751 RepID=A0A372ILR7_9BACT|nr:hypothetical protein [Paracidobacterium acidisoli]MBT9332299.1 hypothetical protein [Paracidobacterium acidisoli]